MIKELALIFQIPILMGGWDGHPPILLNNVSNATTTTTVNVDWDSTDTMQELGTYTTYGRVEEGTWGIVNIGYRRTKTFETENFTLYDYYYQYQSNKLMIEDDYPYTDDGAVSIYTKMLEIHKLVMPSNYGINVNDLTYTVKLNFYETEDNEDTFLATHYTYITTNENIDLYIGNSTYKTQNVYPETTWQELLEYTNYTIYEQVNVATETAQVETTEYYSNTNIVYVIEFTELTPTVQNDGYYMNNEDWNAFDPVQYKTIELDVWQMYELVSSEDYATDIENGNFLSIWGLMLNIITLPFAFISQAVNITLWPGTVASINIGTLVMSILGAIILIFMIKLIVSKFK